MNHTRHKNGNTIVLVTHEEDIALNAKRIVRLRDGLIETDLINDKFEQNAIQIV